MSAWMRRNTFPIVAVLAAAAAVIGVFEALDVIAGSAPAPAGNEGSGADLEGAAALAGLVEVALFLAVGFTITVVVHNRAKRGRQPTR